MKKLITAALLLLTFFTGMSQTTVTGNRLVARETIYLRDYWVDSIKRHYAPGTDEFENATKSLPTAHAVWEFVKNNTGSGGGSYTITINSNVVQICTGRGSCVTTTTVIAGSPSTTYNIGNDSTLIICDIIDNEQVCDTVHLPLPITYWFQNGTRQIAPGIVEYGGYLLHNTELNAGYYQHLFSGHRVYNYNYIFRQNQDFQNSTGIVGYQHRGSAVAGQPDVGNMVGIGLNYTGGVYGASPSNLPGYFGSSVGYWWGVNATGNGSYGLRVDDPAAKVNGIFFHTLDSGTKALTFYGLAPPGSSYIAPINVGSTMDSFEIMTLHDDKAVQLHGLANEGFKVNDTTAYKPVVVDTNGKLFQMPWVAGETNTYTFEKSVTEVDKVVSLVNDEEAPGNSKYYGTDGSGAKGYFDLPAAGISSYTFEKSVAESGGIVALVNDAATPGNSKYYGTDGSGAKGYFDLPAAGISSYTFEKSVAESGGIVALVNDADAPGNSKYYGTDGSGTKGYFDLPAGGGTSTHTVSLVMPSAFNVSGPAVNTGTITVTGAGTNTQTMAGDGTLVNNTGVANFETSGGTYTLTLKDGTVYSGTLSGGGGGGADPRVLSITTSTSIGPNSDNYDMVIVTALASTLNIQAPSGGTPVTGRKMIYRIKDNGTSRSFVWDTNIRFSADLPAPAASTAGKTLYIGLMYNADDLKWDAVSIINNY